MIGLLVLLLLVYFAYPFLALWRIDSALKSGDQLALDAMVDWGRVHESLRKDALSYVVLDSLTKTDANDSKLATLGGVLGTTLGATLIEKLIDGLVNGRTAIELYKKRPNPERADIEWIREVRFLSPTQFHFALQHPNETTPPIKFVMSFSGVEWKVTRIAFDMKQLPQSPPSPAEGEQLSGGGDGYSKPARESLKKLIEKPATR